MKVEGIGGGGPQAGGYGLGQATDAYSKSIQKQIASAQKQMQELSSNEELSLEEKMKKRQELQQKIADLNNQLRQHQMELRRASQQEKQAAKEGAADKRQGQGGAREGAGLSQAGMKSMISADSSIKQAKAQGAGATGLKGRAGVLESEIAQDEARGQGVEKKKEELAEVNRQASAAEAGQLKSLSEANQEIKEAGQEDSKETEAGQERAKDSLKKEEGQEEKTAEKKDESKLPEGYHPVDVLL